jgi:GNAT superfamily N-acetyltransferase
LYDEAIGTLNSMTELTIHPLTPDRWPDLEELFGPGGADGGCWCMFWRLAQKDYAASGPAKNRESLKTAAGAGQPTGLLAYADDQAVGWCGVSPKVDFNRLQRSRIIPPTTLEATWSIVCFFIHRGWRGKAVASGLLNAAFEYAISHGAAVVEAYPVDTTGDRIPAASGYPGTLDMFLAAGFEVLTATEARSGGHSRTIVQYHTPEHPANG